MPAPGRLPAIIFAFAAAVWITAPAQATAGGRQHVQLQRGYDLAYNLDYDEAVAALARAIESDPAHPGGYRGIAAITWLQILFLRGGVLVDSYLSDSGGTISRRRAKRLKPPEELADRFTSHIDRAVELSEAAVRRAPDDPDAHYELGASVALAASYRASIEGDALGALRQAKEAYTAHQTVLELDPRRKDANLTLGIYRYLVSLLPRAVRMLAYLVGFDGGKAEAIRLIEEAAAYPGDSRSRCCTTGNGSTARLSARWATCAGASRATVWSGSSRLPPGCATSGRSRRNGPLSKGSRGWSGTTAPGCREKKRSGI